MERFVSLIGGLVLLSAYAAGSAVGQELKVGETGEFVPLAEGKPYIHVIHEGRAVKVQRVQDPGYELKGYFARTVRQCPPFCIRPEQVDPRVATIGELEMFDFMETALRDGQGLLIDARTPSWFEKGTIPGSINVPFTELAKDPDDPALALWLERFGATPREDPGIFMRLLEQWGWADSGQKTNTWDFTQAKQLVLWCNGPTCGQSPRAITGLLAAGYPPAKLRYYRGGMQLWQLFGLTTVIPSGATVAAGEQGAPATE
jgi:rhodanese-related sulfurtransferase